VAVQAQQERNQRMGNPAFEEEVLFEFSCVDHTELKYQGCVYMAVAGVYEFRFTGALGARKVRQLIASLNSPTTTLHSSRAGIASGCTHFP
jgi:hypothetical protein